MNLPCQILRAASFFIQDFTPVNTCYSFYMARWKSRENPKIRKKSQDLVQENLPK